VCAVAVAAPPTAPHLRRRFSAAPTRRVQARRVARDQTEVGTDRKFKTKDQERAARVAQRQAAKKRTPNQWEASAVFHAPRGRIHTTWHWQQAPACGIYISLWSARPTCQAGRAHARTNRPRFPSTCPGVTGERFRPRSRSHATGNRRTAGIFSFFSLSLSLSFFFWAHADAVTQQGRVTG
jgi:hypothetical protein